MDTAPQSPRIMYGIQISVSQYIHHFKKKWHKQEISNWTHTHTSVYMHIYIYIRRCVCLVARHIWDLVQWVLWWGMESASVCTYICTQFYACLSKCETHLGSTLMCLVLTHGNLICMYVYIYTHKYRCSCQNVRRIWELIQHVSWWRVDSSYVCMCMCIHIKKGVSVKMWDVFVIQFYMSHGDAWKSHKCVRVCIYTWT